MKRPQRLGLINTWVGKGALCALVGLLVGCSGGDTGTGVGTTHDTGRYRPEFMLDTTYTVVQLVDQDACASSLCSLHGDELRRVCAEVVPPDGWIWTTNGDGATCRCGCPELRILTVFQLDSLKKAKQLAEAKTMIKHKAKWDAMIAAKGWAKQVPKQKKEKYPDHLFSRPVPISYQDCTQVDRNDEAIVKCFSLYWTSKASMALWAMGKYADPANYPIFTYRIDPTRGINYPGNNGSWELLGTWSVGEGEVADNRYEIYFPVDFIEAPEVGWELMLFFVGHELGHALSDGVACSTYGDIVCEGQCDHWGASVALRRVCGSGLQCKTYPEIAESAARQLEAYMARIHADPTCGGPMCQVCDSDNAACGYPPMACRAATIRAAIALVTEPDCTRGWYADPTRSTSCTGPRLPRGEPCP